MKNLKIFMFGILLVGMHLTSCKKDADQQLQQGAPAENKEKVFEKSLIIYNADKTNSTTLRFRAASQEQLDKIALGNIEFTLVETPESAKEATDMAAPTIAGDEGSSNKDASLSQSRNQNQVLPEDGILIDLPFERKTESISIEVKSKNLNNSPTEQAAAALSSNLYFMTGYHKIKVYNQSPSPIYVQFRNWHNNQWYDIGPLHTLYKFDDEIHSNCLYTVGAKVEYTSFDLVVTHYKSCH